MPADKTLDIIIRGRDKTGKAFNQVNRRATSLGSSLKLIAGGITAAFAGRLLFRGLSELVKTFAEFDAAMDRVKALTGAVGLQFGLLEKQALRLGRTTQFTARQSAEAMQFFGLAGFNTSEILAAMPGTLNLAAAGMVDVQTAADIAAKTLRGFGLDAKEMGRVADTLTNAMTKTNVNMEQLGESMKFAAPIAKAAGIEMAQVATFIGMLGDAGIQGTMSGTAFRRVLLGLISTSPKVVNELKRMGVEIKENAAGSIDLATVIGDLGAAMSDMTTTQRLQSMQNLVGLRGMTALAVVLAEGSHEFRRMTNAMDETGNAAFIAHMQLDNVKGDFIKLKSATESSATEIGALSEGPLRQLMPPITKFVSELPLILSVIPMEFEIAFKRALMSVTSFADEAWKKLAEWGLKAFNTADVVLKDVAQLVTVNLPHLLDEELKKTKFKFTKAFWDEWWVDMSGAFETASKQGKPLSLDTLFAGIDTKGHLRRQFEDITEDEVESMQRIMATVLKKQGPLGLAMGKAMDVAPDITIGLQEHIDQARQRIDDLNNTMIENDNKAQQEAEDQRKKDHKEQLKRDAKRHRAEKFRALELLMLRKQKLEKDIELAAAVGKGGARFRGATQTEARLLHGLRSMQQEGDVNQNILRQNEKQTKKLAELVKQVKAVEHAIREKTAEMEPLIEPIDLQTSAPALPVGDLRQPYSYSD